jgi:hypothetical protein
MLPTLKGWERIIVCLKPGKENILQGLCEVISRV